MNYNEWRKQIKPDKKQRNYQHVDDSLNLDTESVFQRVVSVITDIKNHQFLPFIKRDEVQIRFRRNALGKTERKRKVRPIMYASHLDSHIYSYFNFLLSIKYEQYLIDFDIDENVIAYRRVKIDGSDKGKSNVHFAKEIFDYIKEKDECVVVTQDIEGFFENLNHKLLKESICKISGESEIDEDFYKVFRSLISYKYIEYADFISEKIKQRTKYNKYAVYKTLKGVVNENKTNKGIPQGSPISGLLANIYLVEFDKEIKQNFPDVFYRRYSDDLVFVCRLDQKEEFLNFIDLKIKTFKLNINSTKSFLSYFKKNDGGSLCVKVTNGLDVVNNRNYVDYLGLEFNGQNIFLRKGTIQKLKHKQIKKASKQILNSTKQKRLKPKRFKTSLKNNRNNYFKRASEVVNSSGVKNQVLKVAKGRNKVVKNIKE
jgi:RNA-directed DNA polymerase